MLALTLGACGKKTVPDPAPTSAKPAPNAESPQPDITDTPPDVSPAAGDVPPLELADGEPRRLSPEGVDARRPQVSPDATRVIFEAGPDGNRDLVLATLTPDAAPQTVVAGPSDDVEATWSNDGERIVFSSNRGGRYQLHVLDLSTPGAAPTLVDTGADSDAREPSLSPLTYTFFAVSNDSCDRSGARSEVVGTYEKVAYTRVDAKTSEVWFASLNGIHRGRVSPDGVRCNDPRYSDDGLSLAMTCKDGDGANRRVVHDTRAAWDQSFGAALEAVAPPKKEPRDDAPEDEGEASVGCTDHEDLASWATDACLKDLPRRYARHDPAPVADPQHTIAAAGYSTNQTLVLGVSAGGAFTRERTATATWTPLTAVDQAITSDLDWSPSGDWLAVSRKQANGSHEVVHVPVDYYLQDVRDLVDFPELWGEGRSQRLHDNRFVARPGTDKEFFHRYDKIMYARRGPFVTADAMLQVLRDEVASLLKAAEATAAGTLRELTRALMDSYASRPASPESRFLAVHFGVAWAISEAASKIVVADEPDPWAEPEPDAKPEVKPLIDQMKAELDAILTTVPEPIRDSVRAHLDRALAHEGFVEVAVPGRSSPTQVDFSQMKPRGHYADSAVLSGYFIAMKWLSMVPMPLDASAVDVVRTMEAGELMAKWSRIDQVIGGFMGRPVDITVSHLADLMKKQPALFTPTFDKAKVHAALKAALGDLKIRGLDNALADDAAQPRPASEPSFVLFPLRLGVDVPTFTGLTHPDVQSRGMPSAIDVFAVMGVPSATRIAKQGATGQEWQKRYEEQLTKLQGEAPRRDAALWSTDLYHGWLALLDTLARPLATPDAARLLFTKREAWGDRLLSGALAGYTQLKHSAVLYAFQDFSAQCADESSVRVFVEQPVLPEARGFVEPNPEFFRAVARLAKRTYELLWEDPATEPTVQAAYYDEDNKSPPLNTRIVAERLALIADHQLNNDALSTADGAFLRTIGATFEDLFLGQQKTEGKESGAGRIERGVAIVTDVHTNVTSQQALQLGLGRIDDLFVVVPDKVGARLTEGGIFSFYEFTHPISDRLTDEQWNAKIVASDLPPRPPWIATFFESGPPRPTSPPQ